MRLAFDTALAFVVGDFHAGPWVRTETGEVKRSELAALIDHASRHVPESRYGLTEDLCAVRMAMRGLCTKAGVPHRRYVDNGPSLQARRFHFARTELAIELVHSRPYVSERRGLVERFNRTVKESFEVELGLRPELPTLPELNDFWWAWLADVCGRLTHALWQRYGDELETYWAAAEPEQPVTGPLQLRDPLRPRCPRRPSAPPRSRWTTSAGKSRHQAWAATSKSGLASRLTSMDRTDSGGSA